MSRPVGNAIKNVSSTNNITDSTEKVNSETKFSYKSPAESEVYKRIAEWKKLKVYEKTDAGKLLRSEFNIKKVNAKMTFT